jgi:hypothetical protein
MEDVAYWQQRAVDFRERAQTTTDPALHEELLDLAAVCEEVAATMEERASSG